METQNITLSLPKDVLRKVKLLAVERGTSISGLLAETLERLVDQETGYTNARQRQIETMDRGFNLGLGDSQPSSREALHER